MSRRGHRTLAATSIAALLVLHVDAWNASRVEPMLLGWIPFDLAYHLAWMVAASLVLFHLTAKVWTEAPPDAREASPPERSPRPGDPGRAP